MMIKRKFEIAIEKIKKIKPTTVFWVTIILMAFVYNFNDIIFSRPVGIHQWRNCVSAGYALNYYHGADFLEPQTEGFVSNDKRSNVVLLEAPILYYAVGVIYKIFGNQEFLYRLFNTLIGFIGLFYLFKTAKLYLNNLIYSLSIPIILFSSTVYIFYMSNFIPDATGLALSLIGFYFFYKFYDSNSKSYKDLLFSMIFFSIAGLLKAQSLYIYF